MALTEAQWQQLILDECGTPDPEDTRLVAAYEKLAVNVPLYWEAYSDKRRLGGLRLQYLYAKQHALQFLGGQVFDAVDFTDADVEESLSDLHDHLKELIEGIGEQIAVAEARSAGVRGYAVGQIQTTTPRPAPPCGPDPSAPAFRGDPLQRTPYWPR